MILREASLLRSVPTTRTGVPGTIVSSVKIYFTPAMSLLFFYAFLPSLPLLSMEYWHHL